MINPAVTGGRYGARVYGLLLLFAVLGVDLAATSTVGGTPFALLSTSLHLALAGLLRWLSINPRSTTGFGHHGLQIAVFTLALVPLWLHTGDGQFGFTPHPLEIVMLLVVRNLMLALAVCVRSASEYQRVVAVSLLLVCCATLRSDQRASDFVLVVYLFTAACSLLARALKKSESVIGASLNTGMPKVPLIVMLLLILVSTAVGRLGPKRTLGTLGQWMASSGGDLGVHVNARAGVGDGAGSGGSGDAADSTGFSDGDSFLESKLPSLYDVAAEKYGDAEPPEVLERTLFLARLKIKFRKGHETSDSARAGRRFALQRRRRSSRRRLQDLHADALFYVEGRTPLHLRAEVFTHFDGVQWYGADLTETPNASVRRARGDWMHPTMRRADRGDKDITAHKLKIGTLGTSVIPLPTHAQCFRMGRVNDPDFFSWYEQGILHMIRSIPATTVIDVHSHLPVPPRSSTSLHRRQTSASAASRDLESVFVDERVALLAREWTEEVPVGWAQVETIVRKLRRRCRLAEASGETEAQVAPIEPSTQDPIRTFLEQTRCGRDVDFASTAVIMLTALGYEARMAGGYYADPERYDARAKHTPVLARDLHFWCEVRAEDERWRIVEPTPGYAVLHPARSWLEVLRSLMYVACTMIRRHAMLLAAILLVLSCLGWQWRRVWNLTLTVIWAVYVKLRPHRAAIATLRLLDARARLARDARPPGCTPARWYLVAHPPDRGSSQESLRTLIRSVEAQLFGAQGYRFGNTGPELYRCCGIVAKAWTLRCLRDRSVSQEGKVL